MNALHSLFFASTSTQTQSPSIRQALEKVILRFIVKPRLSPYPHPPNSLFRSLTLPLCLSPLIVISTPNDTPPNNQPLKSLSEITILHTFTLIYHNIPDTLPKHPIPKHLTQGQSSWIRTLSAEMIRVETLFPSRSIDLHHHDLECRAGRVEIACEAQTVESECGREEGREFVVEVGVREAEMCEGRGVEGVDLLVWLGWPGGEDGN